PLVFLLLAAADAIDFAAVAFGGAACGDVVGGLGGEAPAFGGGFSGYAAFVGFFIELLGNRRGTAHVAEPHDLYGHRHLAAPDGNQVTQFDFTRGFHQLPIDLHPAPADFISSQAAGFIETRCPQPFIETNLVAHVPSFTSEA